MIGWSLFSHFVKEGNEIWYPRKVIISYETFVGFSNEMDEHLVVNVYQIIKQGIIHVLFLWMFQAVMYMYIIHVHVHYSLWTLLKSVHVELGLFSLNIHR